MRTLVRTAPVLLVLALLTGCATTGDLRKVEGRLLAMRTVMAKTRERQQSEIQKLSAEIARLRQAMKAFKTQTRTNVATIGDKVDRLTEAHRSLLGKLEVIQHTLKRLDEQFKPLLKAYAARFGDPTNSKGKATIVIQEVTPEGMFGASKKLIAAGKLKDAQLQLKAFVKKYPTHKLTVEAYLLIGDSYAKLRNYFEAIIWYNDVRKKFKDSGKVDLALFKLGVAHYLIGACPEGRAFFRHLLRKHRSSALAPEARRYIRQQRSRCRRRRR